MNENEQIQEMARIIDVIQCIIMPIEACRNSCAVCKAKRLYSKGYRKVERGHWITREEVDVFNDYNLVDTCSVCGHCDWDCTESQDFNFCPHCGADMRGEK